MLYDILCLGIQTGNNTSNDEIDNLIAREAVASLALDKFLKGLISWNDYLDILETCEIDIDNYLQVANQNCELIT